MIRKGEHLEEEGIRKILQIRREMNDGGKRKYSEEEILSKFHVSSETTRQTSNNEDDIVRSSGKPEVNINERS